MKFYTVPYDDALQCAMAMDREFFEQHPDRGEYRRFTIPGEFFGYFKPGSLTRVIKAGEDGLCDRCRMLIEPPDGITLNDITNSLDPDSAAKFTENLIIFGHIQGEE